VDVTAIHYFIEKAKKPLRLGCARLWLQTGSIYQRVAIFMIRHRWLLVLVCLFILMALTDYDLQKFQPLLENYFATGDRLKGFHSLILTIGGALLGAAAIAFSLVMFALQVSVERMPHGLFRKLSSDCPLLGAFAATFILSIGIAALSLIPNRTWLAIAEFGAFWGTTLILISFLYAYGRALSLISPMKQLEYVLATARKDLRHWSRRERRAAPLFEPCLSG
jgi:uncharacterized membrane protein